MSVVLLDREIVHYEVLGRGRPLIFLHGWVGSWRYWIPCMQAASSSFRTYALDLWGFGDTAKKPERYSLEQQIYLLDGFLEEMGIGRAALVGHGLGAVISVLYAARRPEAIDRVLAVGYPLGAASISARFRSSSPAELANWLLERTPVTEAAHLDAPKSDPQAIKVSMENLQKLNLAEVSASLATACLLVSGQNDPAIQAPPAERLADLPEQTHRIVFEQSGHFPMLEEGSKFNRLLADFLALESGESPRQLQLKEEWKRRVR